MPDNRILVPSLEGHKITWSKVIKPKINTSDPKHSGRAKAVPISQLDQITLNNLSAAQILALFNFSQDILGRVPEDELDANDISLSIYIYLQML
jgi:hypothetical protein